MNIFALVSLGILIGIIFAAILAAVGTVAYTSYRQRIESIQSTKQLLAMQQRSNQLADQLRRDVTAALSAMDANRLHDASVAIQLGARKLDHAVTTLNKVIFAAGMGDSGMGLTAADLDELGDTAQQQVMQYDPATVGVGRNTIVGPGSRNVGYPPPGNFPAAPRDPFTEWKERQQSAAAADSGASFPAAAAGPLPDLDAAFAEDLHDDSVMSDHGIGAVPGMTLEE